VRDELEAREVAIAKLESELGGVKQENKDQVLTIAELENKLIGAMAEIQVMGEVKQLPLFPPEPTPEPNPEPEPMSTPEPTPVTVTVDTPGLVEYINSIEPGSGIKAKTIGNAITRKNNGKDDGEGGKGKNLSSLESTYNFKHLGKVGNSHKFSIPNL